MLRVPNTSSSVIRRSFNSKTITSNRLRTVRETNLLQKEGHAIRVIELQGELVFSSMEKVVRQVHEASAEAVTVILNFRHVLSMTDTCSQLLLKLWHAFAEEKRDLIIAETEHLPRLGRYLRTHMPAEDSGRVRFSDDLDVAMEWAENQLLSRYGRVKAEKQNVALKDYVLCHGFTSTELTEFGALLKPRTYRAAETVLTAGEPSTDLFFLKRGKVSVMVENSEGQRHRVVTYSPGMAFGEVAFLDRSPRSAGVGADTDIECDVLEAASFDAMTATHPALAVKLLRNIAIEFSHTLRRNNNALRLYSR